MAVPKAPKSTKAPKGKTQAPTTHTHRCLADGGHHWTHPDPCDGPKFRTRLCPEHQTPFNEESPVIQAPEVKAELAAEPIAAEPETATPAPVVSQSKKAPKTRPLAIVPPAPEAPEVTKLPLTPLRPDHAPKLEPLQRLMQPVVEKSRRQPGAYVGYIKTFPVGAKAYFRLVSDGEPTQEAAQGKAQAAIAAHVKAGTIPVRYAEAMAQAKAPGQAPAAKAQAK